MTHEDNFSIVGRKTLLTARAREQLKNFSLLSCSLVSYTVTGILSCQFSSGRRRGGLRGSDISIRVYTAKKSNFKCFSTTGGYWQPLPVPKQKTRNILRQSFPLEHLDAGIDSSSGRISDPQETRNMGDSAKSVASNAFFCILKT